MHHRNAASVLPEPVGAQISACSPAAMAGQPWACAGVGSSNDARNQFLVASLKEPSGSGARSGTGFEYRSERGLEQAIYFACAPVERAEPAREFRVAGGQRQ